VPINTTANFLNNSGIPTSNILARVTGGNISNILGTIQTTGFGNANLFLMNPAGFLFGPKATLNVGGMVAFTTADYLRLADGGRFT
jgi:filamentous hemagglutinin family protein